MFVFVFRLVLRRVRAGTHTHTHTYRRYVIQSVNEVTRTEGDNGEAVKKPRANGFYNLDWKILSVGFFFI